MKWIRPFTIGAAMAIGLSLFPGTAPPAGAAGLLVTGQGTVPLTAGQSLPLAAFFTPVHVAGTLSIYSKIGLFVDGALTFSDGSTQFSADGQQLSDVLNRVAVKVKGSGKVSIVVGALVNGQQVFDSAETLVDAPVPLVASAGTVSAAAGQTLALASLFAFQTITLFREVDVAVTLTGGLVFANGTQSTMLSGLAALKALNTSRVTANRSGAATLKMTVVVNDLRITADATTAVNVPTQTSVPPPAPAPTAAPTPTAAPEPAPTAIPSATPSSTPAPVATAARPGNRPPTATGKVAVVKAGTSTAIVLTGTDPEGARLVYSVVGLPENGRLKGRAPNLTYVPTKGFVGPDTFTYTVSDGVSTSEEVVVSITVISAKKAMVRKATKRKK